MPDHDLAEVGTFLGKYALCDHTRTGCRMSMDRDRHASLGLSLAYGAHHPFHSRRQSGFFDGAFEERGFDAGVRDAFADILDEQLHHRLGDIEQQPRARVMELERDVVIRVNPGCRNDVDIDLLVDSYDAWQVPSQSPHC